QVDREEAKADLRTKFEAAAIRFKRFARTRRFNPPTCFISYAWGAHEHERWVEKSLAADLKKAGMTVVLDRWAGATIGTDLPRFISQIEACNRIVVVGTPLYQQKYENKVSSMGSVVAAEVDLIQQRLLGTEDQKKTVLPVLLSGEPILSLPPLMRGKVFADFRRDEGYFAALFDLILTLYG